MRCRNTVRAGLLALAFGAGSGAAAAQPLGTFHWQLQPFCNVLTVQVSAAPDGVFRLEGADDQCGAPDRAPAVGVATMNGDGTVALGLHLVTAGGRPLAIDARVQPASGDGGWSDSAGNSGRLVLGGAAPGARRPPPSIPATAIAAGSITAAQLAPGLIGAVAQRRVAGVCTNGQALRGIDAAGNVACTNATTSIGVGTPQFGRDPSIALAPDGRPWVAYTTGTARTLMLMRCGDSACVAGNRSVIVADAPPGAGQYVALRFGSDGLPVLAYYDPGATRLVVTHCGDLDCRAGNVTRYPATSPSAGEFVSLAIGADGLPVMAYYDRTRSTLAVTRCRAVNCATWANAWPDPTRNDAGQYPSLAIGTDGLPVISHFDATAGTLRVTHCGAADCSGQAESTTVDAITGREVGVGSTLAIGRDGFPVIAHFLPKEALRVTHCGNAACTAGNTSTTVTDTADAAGLQPSIAIGADGLAVISHVALPSETLRVTHCDTVACTSARTSRVDPLDDPNGYDSSLVIGGDGLPIVAHYIKSGSGLRVTKCGTPSCQ